jgi:transmembrane sensor
VRLDNGPLTFQEEEALDRWLIADERRRGALLRAEATLAYLQRGRALAEKDQEPRSTWSIKRKSVFAFSAAACLALVGVSASFGPLFQQSEAVAPPIKTALGEVRRVPLADGSTLTVNTSSAVTVAMTSRAREVKLENGEAWFEVAHDKRRPFVVDVGDVRVKAVGTAFSVRRRANGVDVLVTEGIVESWVEGKEGQAIRISAGSKAEIVNGAPAAEIHSSEDIERELAWRTGNLALSGETLAFAASELNRYNKRRIVIHGDDLGRERLVGYFRTDRPEDFARATAQMTEAQVRVDGDTIHLLR